ncbi:MAG: tyrosine-type recombinase/integrase [Planctomycetes bacterium]|nr:tyrosine-type recombinase/integrase [Planctomycetota bacterium]
MLDPDDDTLWLRTTKGDRPDRTEPASTVVEPLRRWIGDRSGPVFCDRQGNRILHRQAQRRFAGWCIAAGIKRASLHGLRHSFAVGLYRESRDLLAIQRALGHRSVSATVVYARSAVP